MVSKKLPKPKLYVVFTRYRGMVRVYGPYRKGTALRYRILWRQRFGEDLEARVVTLDRFEDLPDGMERR